MNLKKALIGMVIKRMNSLADHYCVFCPTVKRCLPLEPVARKLLSSSGSITPASMSWLTNMLAFWFPSA